MNLIRYMIKFYGHVQGVGFRWTATRIAADYAVSGWVKNLPDGCVELLVEGKPAETERFLSDLRSQMSGYIRNEESSTAPATGEFSGFTVKY